MRLSEIYQSVQGEGPRTGVPTTFIRFGGCNLRCPGWGKGLLPDGTEVAGCDTVFAVYPEWRPHWEQVTPYDILERVPVHPRNICITGGEPFTQPSGDLSELVTQLYTKVHTIDIFTNGSRDLTKFKWATEFDDISLIMDYKLPGSGEYGSFQEINLTVLRDKDVLKFVCKDREDFDTAKAVIRQYGYRIKSQIYFTPVWGELDPEVLAGWVTNDAPGTRMALQTHKYIWGDIRGV